MLNPLKIKSIKQRDYIGPVYNLAVEHDESFVAESLILHNCRCRTRALTREEAGDRGGISGKNRLIPDEGFSRRPEPFQKDQRKFDRDIQALGRDIESQRPDIMAPLQ